MIAARTRAARTRSVSRACLKPAGLRRIALAFAAGTMTGIEPALAHHAMDGEMPSTFAQGLISGLAHPVIGLDHLAAVVGVGVLAAVLARGFAPALAFIAAMIGGVALHLMRTDVPAAELLVGLSTVAIGLMVAFRLVPGAALLTALFAAAGIVHGYALGESMVGAEPTPLGAYLAGLLVVQSLIAALSWAAARAFADRPAVPRAAGMPLSARPSC